MICSICEEVSQVPTGTRIPTAFINTVWDRRLESGRQRDLDLSPPGRAAASQADGNSGGEDKPREQVRRPTAGREPSPDRCAEVMTGRVLPTFD
jgi:hypothetical protein